MTDLITLSKKEIINFLRLWKQTLVPSVITIILYFAIFGKIIGEKIDIDYTSIYNVSQQITYIEFIFPWLLMMAVIMGSYALTSFWFFTAKMFHSLEELLISPISNTKIILWYSIAWLARGCIVWFLVCIAASFMIDIQVHNPFLLIVFILLTSLVFSLAWLLNAIYAKSFDDVNIIPSFIITPLIYLWWVFYSVNMLPDFWATVSQFNPILYMINGLRYSFLWVSDVDVSIAIVILILFTIVLYTMVHFLLKTGKNIKS